MICLDSPDVNMVSSTSNLTRGKHCALSAALVRHSVSGRDARWLLLGSILPFLVKLVTQDYPMYPNQLPRASGL